MEDKTLKILVVDDIDENRSLVMRYLNRLGHQTVFAVNGEDAIKVFENEQPNIVLMDVMMPVMNGYDSTRAIRELCGTRWMPIIFMSANTEINDQVKGIEAGGDDYLPKPVNLRLLKAKIGAMQRIESMQSEINRYNANAQSEMDLAKKLVENMTRNTGLNDPALNCWFKSAEKLSGDLIAASRARDARLNVMVADATGHGLSAAMSQLPVSQCFYEMTKSGYSIPGMVSEMNAKLKEMLTTERYVAATIASIDFSNQVVEIWNGSGPPAYYVSQSGEILHEFHSTECAMGIVDDDTYRLQTQIYQWKEPGELIIYSDGLLDVSDENGELYGEDRLVKLFTEENHGTWFARIKDQVLQHYDQNKSFDDISLVSVSCGVSEAGLQAAAG